MTRFSGSFRSRIPSSSKLLLAFVNRFFYAASGAASGRATRKHPTQGSRDKERDLMFSPLSNRFGIPGVISVIALVFAMLGGAYAASSNSGGGKASASAKAKKGPRGPKGATGPAGPAGPPGPASAQREAGPDGDPARRAGARRRKPPLLSRRRPRRWDHLPPRRRKRTRGTLLSRQRRQPDRQQSSARRTLISQLRDPLPLRGRRFEPHSADRGGCQHLAPPGLQRRRRHRQLQINRRGRRQGKRHLP